jgi:2,3-bisphosphoglycerate-independent phosphoglycerate mutase
MKLVLEASVLSLESFGPAADAAEVAQKLDGTEIDGSRFSFSAAECLRITMEAPVLSDDITTNQPRRPAMSICQVGFKKPEARYTANTLNKLMRRANKEFPGRTLVITEVKELTE